MFELRLNFREILECELESLQVEIAGCICFSGVGQFNFGNLIVGDGRWPDAKDETNGWMLWFIVNTFEIFKLQPIAYQGNKYDNNKSKDKFGWKSPIVWT